MPKIITEDMIERAAIALLLSEYASLYSHLNCHTEKPETLSDGTGRDDKKQVVLPTILYNKLCELNPDIPKDIIRLTANNLCRNAHGDPLGNNYNHYQFIRNQIKVSFKKDGRETQGLVRLIDFGNPENNSFIVASQMWIRGEVHWRRPDLIIFVNGLPFVFIELKNSNINVKNAYDKNLTDYRRDIPWLFNYNQICVLSNGMETRLGSFSAGYEHFFEWLKIADEKENPDRLAIREDCVSLEYFIRGLCRPDALLDYIENFVLFDQRKGGVVKSKIIAKNHQYHGVNNAFYAFEKRSELKGRLGVFWHTQGSGKSYSMVMLARKVKRKCIGNFTFLIVTDRDDLDGQIYKTFLRSGFMGDREKCKPANSAALREELKTNKGILFTLIHKFRYDKGKKYPILSERDDIIVFVDEAHRTQYKDLAENMRTGLPNAQYIAFTGTPLLGSRRLTNQWFGDYVSEYNFAESVTDGATVPLYYVKRVPEVELRNDFFDNDFSEILESENLTDAEQRRLENYYAQEMEVIKRDDRLDAVARHIVRHFPYRGFRGKGMVISVDKFTAVKMYDKVSFYWREEIKKLNADITRAASEEERDNLKSIVDYMRSVQMAVVISEDADEESKFKNEGLSVTAHRNRMAEFDEDGADIEDNFKNPDHPLSLVFICAMWLTGFDAPSVSTLYLDKPMKGHTLMQAIARANRVFPDKENGVVVDFLDVFKYLRRALADYASDGGEAMPVKDIERLLEQLNQAIEMTLEFCSKQEIDLSRAIAVEDTFRKMSLFHQFANTILSNDEVRNEFRTLANTVDNLYESLRPDIFNMDFDPINKEAILYLRGVIDGTIRPDKLEAAKKRVGGLLDESVQVEEDALVYTIPEFGREIDLSKIDVDGLRDRFRAARYRNILIADLREHIEKKIEQMLRRNVTRSDFAERFRNIIDAYNAGGSQSDVFYEKILKFMEELRAEEERHIKEELSEAELEIFDLLRKDRLTKDEEKRVKLAAKKLYATLLAKKSELFVVGWHNDPQPKERVRSTICDCLNTSLPDCYDRDIFAVKSNIVYEHIVDQAMMGYAWVA
ncbi:MAG: type I restriction endonuclease subunit R [Chitinispirillales bacterium]|jgi:type I restriction enzyme R subunit|nr:type I restriction endonuclease subunit R [Chitinispirillales bacterium]